MASLTSKPPSKPVQALAGCYVVRKRSVSMRGVIICGVAEIVKVDCSVKKKEAFDKLGFVEVA